MALDLGKQMGPLPLGAWIVVVGGGLGIAWYSRRAGTGEVVEPQEDIGGQPGVGDGSVGGGWVPTQPPTGGGSVPDPKDAVTDNDKWYTYISRELIGRFNYDPVLVDSALRKYLAGGRGLSVSEWVIVRAALAIMTPPNPIPAMPDDPSPPPVTPPGIPKPPVPKPPAPGIPGPVIPRPKPPAPKPPPPKPSYRYYTVRKGDNLWNISIKYYGAGYKYGTIFSANRYGVRRKDGKTGMIKSPSLIQPGWVLLIP